MKKIWYFLDPDNRESIPAESQVICQRCGHRVKRQDHKWRIVLHNDHPWFRLVVSADEETKQVLGPNCYDRLVKNDNIMLIEK